MLLLRTNKVKSSVKNSFIKPKRALITAVIALGIMAMTKLRPLPYSIKSIKGTRLLAVLVALFLFSQIFQMAGVGRNLKNSKWIANADASPFTRRQPTSCSKCKRPSTDHYLNFAYFSEDEDMTSTLTLNNNKNEATVVEITIFNSKGEPFRLAPISLASQQVSRLSVRELTKDARGDFKSGNIQVFYHGPAMGVTGQVTITSIKERISFESSPTEAMMFTSTTLDGIVWVPDEKTKASVALTNTASSPITVTASSGQNSQGRQKAFTLEPRETQVLNLNEFVDKQKGLPSAALVSLTHSGAAGDLITTGFALNGKTGFACNVNFVDRSGTKSNRLAGAHLRFGSARPEEGFPSGTTFRSPLVIANAGDLPSEVKIAVDYTVNDIASRVELETLTLAALAVKQIDLAQEMAQRGVVGFVDNAGVDISYTGAAGSVIGRLTSVDTTGDFSFEVPIKDPLAGMNRVSGSYPWRLDQGYNTVLHLKNTLDKEVNALIQIRYKDGTYNPELIKIAPYQTVALDIKRIRDEQKKDIRGTAMPKDATSGKLIWYEQTVGSLIGRAEVFNAKARMSSSFSCPGNCHCPPDFFRAFMSPSSYIGVIGQSGQFFLPLEIRRDCDMIEYGPFEISGSDWLSMNPSCAEVTSPGGVVSCLGVGNADILATFASVTYEWDIGEVCIPHNPTAECSGSMTVVSITLTATGIQEVGKSDHYISLINTGNVTITATLNPPGTDPSVIEWTNGSAGSDNLHRVISTSSASDTVIAATVVGETDEADTVKIHVVDATTPPPGGNATITYSNGGFTSPGSAFGTTLFYDPSDGVNYPTYNVDAYFSSDRWVFRVRNIMHTYKQGIDSHTRIDLPVGNPPVFPTVQGLTLEESHNLARSDLDITGLPAGTEPIRSHYWVRFIVENHEQYHATDFYSQLYWFNYMGLFEIQDVEATTVNVIFDCLDTTTTTRLAAVTKMTPTWNTAIGNRHVQAFNAYNTSAEVRACAAINPQYVPIRDAIPNP